ncbi:hypothetical protein [Pseudovibrio japonicus]|uniref:hypothetical protein n=1 Tax=Pseudovibrio japonicus TaxID=366534 RepID=UPI001674825D|nr:hypothetical protein [Pseudovibrio japonicus]
MQVPPSVDALWFGRASARPNTVGVWATSTDLLRNTLPSTVAPSSSHQLEGRSPKLPVA